MTIGERIKRIRTKRGMTQKEFGLALGFPARSADVRIAQYESGIRKPKDDLIAQMAAVLHVNPHAISSVDYGTYIGLMYTFLILKIPMVFMWMTLTASSASGWINIIRITSICWKCWKSGMPLGNRITMILPLWMNTRTGS